MSPALNEWYQGTAETRSILFQYKQFPQNHDIESDNSNALFFSQWKIQKQHI